MVKTIDARIRRALGGIRLAFRGVITLVKAAGQVQFVQLNGVAGEQLQDAELFQQFGYTSNPPQGTMCVVLPIGGRTAHGIVIATEHGTYRLKNLASGETALYNQWGDYVKLGADRHMKLVSSVAVDIQSPTTTVSGDLQVQGSIVAQGDISDHGNKKMADMRTVFNGHTQAVSGAVAAAPTAQM
jgi:phage baseplate assembly protein V